MLKLYIMKCLKILFAALMIFAFSSTCTLNAGSKLCPSYYSRYYLHCNVCGNDAVPSCLFNTEVGTGGDCYTEKCPGCATEGICVNSVG